jgi:HK97 family phage major capsid protein
MPELTKEQLQTMIVETAKAQVEAAQGVFTENMKSIVKEMAQEAAKGVDDRAPRSILEEREDPKGGFYDMADFAKSVYDAGAGLTNPGPKLKAWNEKAIAIEQRMSKTVGSPSQTTGTLEGGGALIPPEFSRNLLVRAKERSSILSRVTTVPMATTSIEIPFINSFDHSQGKVAGNVKFRWLAEMAAATENDVKFKMIELRLREANALVYVSNNLMKFSPISIQPFLTTAVDDAFDLAISDAFFNGTGAGQPLGVLNSKALVAVAKEANQDADTIVYENTLKMLARFYGRRGEWYAIRDVIPQLGVMNVSVGAGGSAVFVAGNMGGNATGAFPGALHGAPLVYEEVCSALGDQGDINLIDWSQYLVGQYSGGVGIETSESMHLKFDYRQTAFQFTFFMDGQPWWPEAYVPKTGTSKSPYVTLAAR